jgi:hypothetical protein
MKKLFFTLIMLVVASAAFAQTNARMRSEDSNLPEIDNLSGLKPDETDLVPTYGVSTFSSENTATGTTGTNDDYIPNKGVEGNAIDADRQITTLDGTQVYPNPASNYITIATEVETGTIRILNLLGQEMSSHQISSTLTGIDITDLTEGIYFVSIESGSMKITKKIKVLY